MAVLTELALRSMFFNQQADGLLIKLPEDTILTPAAKSYLQEKKIEVQFVGETNGKTKEVPKKGEPPIQQVEQQPQACGKYRLLQGGYLDEKPEHMTSLNSNILVYKDHKRIIFRGKLDSLQAKIIEVQSLLAEKNMFKLVDDLSVVLDFVRRILRAEVTEEKMVEMKLFDMDEKQIREMSHHPEKYFKAGHFQPVHQMGLGVVFLNGIRTLVRETELAAYQAYKKEDGSTERNDIISALNRLSSLCYVLMFKAKTGEYDETKEGRL